MKGLPFASVVLTYPSGQMLGFFVRAEGVLDGAAKLVADHSRELGGQVQDVWIMRSGELLWFFGRPPRNRLERRQLAQLERQGRRSR